MKKIISALLALSLVFTMLLTGCGARSSTAETTAAAGTTAAGTAAAAAPKVGIVLTTSGKGDKSYNDAAIAGLDRLKAETGINYKEIQPKEVADIEKSIEFLAKEQYDLVFTIGFNAATALKTVAEKYPGTKFVIIDYNYGDQIPANVKSIVFKEQESSYLGGVLAAGMTKSRIIGFVGGMESPTIQKFEFGYEAGAAATDSGVQVLSSYISSDASGFNNPTRAKEIALDMINKGADIIYYAAGGSGTGVLEATSESGIKAIGVDSNQNWIKPGAMYASVVKRVDVAIIDSVNQYLAGSLAVGKTEVRGLAEQGVGLTDLDKLTVEETEGVSEADQKLILDLKNSIPAEVKEKVAAAQKAIIDGTIVVPYTK